jgi:Glycosyl hydrolase family 92 N-terminal domain
LYKAKTSQGAEVELAATSHAAMYRYAFPDAGGNLVVDLSHRLPSFRGFGLEQQFQGGNLKVEPDGRYQGSSTFSNGYNMAPPWTMYFCVFLISDALPRKHAYQT